MIIYRIPTDSLAIEQLQKMKILPTAAKATPKTPVSNDKRRSIQEDFPKFKPLNSDALKSFSTMRDPHETNGERSRGSRKDKAISIDDSDEDIDAEDTVVIKAENANERDTDAMLSPEDAKRQGELAEGVQKIRVCFFLYLLKWGSLARSFFFPNSLTDDISVETPTFRRR